MWKKRESRDECVVNHSGFSSDPDTDPTRGSDPDLDPILVPSRSRSGPEGTRIRNILTSPTLQVFFSLSFSFKITNILFFQTAPCVHLPLEPPTPTRQEPSDSHTGLAANSNRKYWNFFPFSKKNYFLLGSGYGYYKRYGLDLKSGSGSEQKSRFFF